MMKRVLPFIAGAVLLTNGCSQSGVESAGKGALPLVVKGIKLEQVKAGAIMEDQEAVGTIKAVNGFVLAARIAGTVAEMRVKEGDRVRKGQLLAVLSADEATAGAAAAEAGVEEGSRALAEAKSRKKLADATFQRYQKLFAEQAVTRQELESRQMEQEVATQGVLRAESRLLQARENSRVASAMSGYAKLVSPTDGVVTVKSADRGDTVFPGTPVLSIEDDSGYRLEIQVPESLKEMVNAGQSVKVILEGRQPELGRIVEMSPVINPSSRSFTVKVAVAGKGLRSGAYGRALFPLGSVQGILLPRSALLERGTLSYVWVIDGGNVARMRLVKPGKIYAERVAILSGIESGERVAISGVEKLTDGAKVE
jgi:RND family efflux transporter MFP subunit